MTYVELPSDFAFTWFINTVTPESFSDEEWALFRHLKLRSVR